MALYIKTLTGKTLNIYVSPDFLIEEVKDIIHEDEGIIPD